MPNGYRRFESFGRSLTTRQRASSHSLPHTRPRLSRLSPSTINQSVAHFRPYNRPFLIFSPSCVASATLLRGFIARTMAQYQTYRLSKVPFGTSNEVVRSWFPHENVRNISCATSLEYEYGCETPTCVLTVTFVGLPASLSKLKPTGPGIYLADVVHNDLGSEFAPLNDVKNTVEFVK